MLQLLTYTIKGGNRFFSICNRGGVFLPKSLACEAAGCGWALCDPWTFLLFMLKASLFGEGFDFPFYVSTCFERLWSWVGNSMTLQQNWLEFAAS